MRRWWKWSKENVLRMIRERKERGLPLNGLAVIRQDSGLYQAAFDCFGKNGWQRALMMEGIDPKAINPRIKWTKETMVARIKELKDLGVPLYASYLKRSGYGGMVTQAWKLFGSWQKAIEAAGIEYHTVRRGRRWSKQEVIAEIQLLAKNGVDLSSSRISASHYSLEQAARRYFHSWVEAVTAAGIDYRRCLKNWSYKAWFRITSSEEMERINLRALTLAEKRRRANG